MNGRTRMSRAGLKPLSSYSKLFHRPAVREKQEGRRVSSINNNNKTEGEGRGKTQLRRKKKLHFGYDILAFPVLFAPIVALVYLHTHPTTSVTSHTHQRSMQKDSISRRCRKIRFQDEQPIVFKTNNRLCACACACACGERECVCGV